MSPARTLFIGLTALTATTPGQLTVTRVTEIVRHPYHFTGLAIVDLDGDGDSDFVIHGEHNALTAWCENRGDGTFSTPIPIEVSPRAYIFGSPYFADLEGDGFSDYISSTGHIFIRNTGGSFGASEALPGGTLPAWNEETGHVVDSTPFEELCGVFPGNPDKLLVSIPSAATRDPILAFYGLAPDGAHFIAPILAGGEPIRIEWPYSSRGWTGRDIDADGHLDLIHSDSSGAHFFRNDGAGNFGPAETLPAKSHRPPVVLRLEGQALPVIVYHRSAPEEGSPILLFRPQIESAGKISLATGDLPHFISSGADSEAIDAIAVVSGMEGDELWVKFLAGSPLHPTNPLRCYRYHPSTGWEVHAEVELPAIGLGAIDTMKLEPKGPPGLAIRFGGEPFTFAGSEGKILWASLESLRAETPDWRTLAGPFSDFTNIRLADFDLDGELDLISGHNNHGLGYGPGGRFHWVFGIETEREQRVTHLDDTRWFSEMHPLFGNRIAIGDIDGDSLPDLALSDGPGAAIHLLKNLGNRQFVSSGILASSPDASLFPLLPLRFDTSRHLYFEGSLLLVQSPQPGSAASPLYDLGTTGTLVFTDMDGDGIADVVASPCPLGNVTGWGKVGSGGSIVSWRLLHPSSAREIRTSSGIPEMAWIAGGMSPGYVRVREGIPGVESTPLPHPIPDAETLLLWPLLDLDGDGDLDFLALRSPPPEESLFMHGPRNLVWHENRGTHWTYHPDALLRTSCRSPSAFGVTVQPIENADRPRILFSTGEGEIFLLDFAAPVPGGTFGEWLASHGLSGASAGPLSDPDGDGLTNLEEALQGTSPVTSTGGAFSLPVAVGLPDGWTFSTALALEGSGISVLAETSENLEDWSPLDSPLVALGETGGRHIYRLSDVEMEAPRRFLRLRFTWSAPD